MGVPPHLREPRYRDPDAWRSNRHGLPAGMSPAERIAQRVRHRVRASERRLLAEQARGVASLAEEIEALRAKAAADPVASGILGATRA